MNIQYSICGKTRGGQQCIFDYFLEANENLGVESHQRGLIPPDNSSTVNIAIRAWHTYENGGGESEPWKLKIGG